MSSYAELIRKQKKELDEEWKMNRNPMLVMRRYILQDIDLIDWWGLKRIEKECRDFDAPEYITPGLTDEEIEAKQKLYDQLRVIEQAWKTVCDIESTIE